jgi:predicted RNA-binding Zn-ribbon protein involved in translation (DUF1610 family)
MADEDLYLWGMFKNKCDNRDKAKGKLVCPKCGSKQIYKVTLQESVFVKLDIPYKCNKCGFFGKPKLIKSDKNK